MKKAFFVVIDGDDDVVSKTTQDDIFDCLADEYYGMGADFDGIDVMPARDIRNVPKRQDVEEFFAQLDA